MRTFTDGKQRGVGGVPIIAFHWETGHHEDDQSPSVGKVALSLCYMARHAYTYG